MFNNIMYLFTIEKEIKQMNKINESNKKVSVIGLGYVGLPIAVAFARKVQRKVNANDNFAYAKMAAWVAN